MRTRPSFPRIVALAVTVALAVAGCSLPDVLGGDATTAPAATSTTDTSEETTTSTTAPASTTAPPSTTPDTSAPTQGDFETVSCGELSDDILCEAVELIRRHYVDPVAADALVAAALQALQEADVPAGGGIETCPLPSEEFLVLCEEIDAAGLDPESAEEVAVAGMVTSALDRNSAYFDQAALELVEEEQSGQIEGIGALVSTFEEGSDQTNTCQIVSETCRLEIVSTIEGGPAAAAGLQPGDEFVEVDGRSITGWNVDEVTATVRGPAGSDVELTMRRDGSPLTFTITRAAVEVPVVQSQMVGDVAYLRLNLFTSTADEQVRDELRGLLANDPTALVFDLRNNPGGLLDTSVNVASEFISEGIVVSTESPESTTAYDVESGGVATNGDLPVYVVVNQGSASASEVVAGALDDNERAVIVGKNTFGKNTVQQRFPLSNGGAVKLTIARWYTPEGRDFGGDGIAPDVEAELPETLSVPDLVDRVVDLAA